MSERARNLIGWSCVGIVGLAACAGIVYGLWHAMLRVPPNAARAWALGLTLLMPPALWLAFRLGTWYARGVITGIDWGIGKVAQAGSSAADLRVHVHQEMRRRPDPVTVLPDVEIVHRQLGSGEDVEL